MYVMFCLYVCVYAYVYVCIYLFVLSFIGNQSPTDVHVVPESTASLRSFSGRAKRCVSLESLPTVNLLNLGQMRTVGLGVKVIYYLRICWSFSVHLLATFWPVFCFAWNLLMPHPPTQPTLRHCIYFHKTTVWVIVALVLASPLLAACVCRAKTYSQQVREQGRTPCPSVYPCPFWRCVSTEI